MSVFAAIVDGGSLSAAGRRLNVPLATVSRKLADLEAHLKTRLITRSTRKLVLTDAGRDYLDACRQILEQVDEAERAASGAYAKVKGQLVVAAPVVFGRLHVVPVAAAFLEPHPEVDIQLRLGDRNVNLIEEHVDVALRIGDLPDSNLVATQVGTIRRVVCASPAYLKRFGTPQSLGDLAAHRCITFDGLEAASAWIFSGADGEASGARALAHDRLDGRCRHRRSRPRPRPDPGAVLSGRRRLARGPPRSRACGRGATSGTGEPDLPRSGAASDEDPRLHRLRGGAVAKQAVGARLHGCRASATDTHPSIASAAKARRPVRCHVREVNLGLQAPNHTGRAATSIQFRKAGNPDRKTRFRVVSRFKVGRGSGWLGGARQLHLRLLQHIRLGAWSKARTVAPELSWLLRDTMTGSITHPRTARC